MQLSTILALGASKPATGRLKTVQLSLILALGSSKLETLGNSGRRRLEAVQLTATLSRERRKQMHLQLLRKPPLTGGLGGETLNPKMPYFGWSGAGVQVHSARPGVAIPPQP